MDTSGNPAPRPRRRRANGWFFLANYRRLQAVAQSRKPAPSRKLAQSKRLAASPRSPAPARALPEPRRRRQFGTRLLTWYRQYGRTLPWRTTDDPYHILVSEVMLQQTQVDRVLPKYAEWLVKYPSLHALAEAAEEDVVRTWYPLGYNIRPKRLQTIAREAVARYDGRLPSDEVTLRSFKGIGAYTAGALLSFAFGQRAAILDTNVARVLLRVFVGSGDVKAHAMKRDLWELSRAVLPQRDVFDFNQALMDFGATLCTARKPACLVCPMQSMCVAYPFTPEPAPAKSAASSAASKNLGGGDAEAPLTPKTRTRTAAQSAPHPPRGTRVARARRG
jgi:A/G-specific adenine glycosylase